jgi:hypothetical protein
VGGRIFATLASMWPGYRNLTGNLKQQAMFVGEAPEVFPPIAVEGRMGATHIRLAKANEDVPPARCARCQSCGWRKNKKPGACGKKAVSSAGPGSQRRMSGLRVSGYSPSFGWKEANLHTLVEGFGDPLQHRERVPFIAGILEPADD